uniref:Mediator of RNA polymerase II transcription subunit 6 n=1 Tax=Melanopsichium pennsylvanicum 4 TaxID=1398559 RepID=A0A077QY34_9BASI|nr:med6-domain-containing protein [Melanopsichium pennsylvanicum 4]
MSAAPLAGSASEAPSNLLHVQFKNPEYLSFLTHLHTTGQLPPSSNTSSAPFDPAHPLNEQNVMGYFATSPFFDRRSNNEQIRMQNIANGLQNITGGMGAKQEEQELKRFTGLEFVLVHARSPSCFVVQKRWRTSPTESKSSNHLFSTAMAY